MRFSFAYYQSVSRGNVARLFENVSWPHRHKVFTAPWYSWRKHETEARNLKLSDWIYTEDHGWSPITLATSSEEEISLFHVELEDGHPHNLISQRGLLIHGEELKQRIVTRLNNQKIIIE